MRHNYEALYSTPDSKYSLTCTEWAGSAQLDSNINLVGTWSKDTIPSTWLYNNTYNEVWGFEQKGREYVVIGSTLGTHFIDVTDTNNIHEVDFVKGALFGPRVVHRDYHDYNGYLYMVCGEGNSTLQIVDLQYLSDSVHLVYDSDEFINISHNIFIDSSSARLYAMAVYTEKTFNRYAGVRVLSLENPEKPSLLGDFLTQSDCHDAYVRNDTVYLNIAHEGLKVYDFANPESPKELDHLFFYPGMGYNHSGWLHENSTIYAFADETPTSPIKICDASTFPNIKVLITIKAAPDSSMVHNLIIKGNLLYVSYYNEGLYVYDISDPVHPKTYAYYDTYLANNPSNFLSPSHHRQILLNSIGNTKLMPVITDIRSLEFFIAFSF